jgi:hypothetical protein
VIALRTIFRTIAGVLIHRVANAITTWNADCDRFVECHPETITWLAPSVSHAAATFDEPCTALDSAFIPGFPAAALGDFNRRAADPLVAAGFRYFAAAWTGAGRKLSARRHLAAAAWLGTDFPALGFGTIAVARVALVAIHFISTRQAALPTFT